MSMFLKRLGLALCLALMAFGARAEELRIGTASLGGAFFPIGQSISNLVNAHAGGDLTMVPIVTGGSVQNPRLVASGDVDLAITNNDLAAQALAGTGPYKGPPMELAAVGALHPSVLHMVVLDGSDIETFADLKGKRVAVGPAGGGTLGFLNKLLPIHDMTVDDITPSFLSYADGFSQLSDGNVDAALALSGYPASAVMQAAAGNKLRMIRLADPMMEKMLADHPAYTTFDIAPDVYGMDDTSVVIGVNNVLVVPADADPDTVERITRSIYEHLDEFAAENANARQIDPARSASLTIPLHEGAARVFGQ